MKVFFLLYNFRICPTLKIKSYHFHPSDGEAKLHGCLIGNYIIDFYRKCF